MSTDPPACPEPAAAPETADTEPAAPPEDVIREIDGVPLMIMKGGTSSGAHDRERARLHHEAEARRAKQDAMPGFARQDETMTAEGFVRSSLSSLSLMDSGAPQLVLYYLNRDGSVRQECISEMFVLDNGDSGFVMVCPKCLERGEDMGASQMQILKSHRAFEVDTRQAGKLVKLVTPDGLRHVRICGTVTVNDVVRCSSYNCNYAVRIDQSKVIVA